MFLDLALPETRAANAAHEVRHVVRPSDRYHYRTSAGVNELPEQNVRNTQAAGSKIFSLGLPGDSPRAVTSGPAVRLRCKTGLAALDTDERALDDGRIARGV